MCCFQGVRVMSYICFLPDTKNLHKIPKIVHSTVQGSVPAVFSCFHQYSGQAKKRESTSSTKKIVNFDKMSNFFRQSFFRNFFMCTFFSEFFWKAKLTIFGKSNVFRPFEHFLRKIRHFFSEKIGIFFDFFRIFFRKKKFAKKHKKT